MIGKQHLHFWMVISIIGGFWKKMGYIWGRLFVLFKVQGGSGDPKNRRREKIWSVLSSSGISVSKNKQVNMNKLCLFWRFCPPSGPVCSSLTFIQHLIVRHFGMNWFVTFPKQSLGSNVDNFVRGLVFKRCYRIISKIMKRI